MDREYIEEAGPGLGHADGIPDGSEPLPNEVEAVPLSKLRPPDGQADPNELIKERFLCRGGGMLLVGPTGVGKSSFTMQMMIQFARGQEFLGLRPNGKLKTLLIQAENDEGDLSEMCYGVVNGLDIEPEEAASVFDEIHVATCDSKSGPGFLDQVADPLLVKHKPDLLFIDPLFAYLGGDASKQEIVSPWLRNGLNPLLHKHGCGCVIVHHTNKPPSGQANSKWAAGDFAYSGSGSSEHANWARAVVMLRSIGQQGVYELRLAKRGSRARWLDGEDRLLYTKTIAHSRDPDAICWREADPAESEAAKGRGRAPAHTVDDVIRILGRQRLAVDQWREQAKNDGIGRSTFFELKKQAIKERLVTEEGGLYRSASGHKPTHSDEM